ncbi:hypothetical protein GF351_00880 [Candidatus Woesearchaeota archaeon]|nr:hypothetical protein [Candidatus Woesearchaeota archaeon]
MTLQKTVRDIKSLKIQGAKNIAVSAVKALSEHARSAKPKSAKGLIKELDFAKRMLFASRPTEPCMRNALNFVMNNVHGEDLEHLRSVFHMNVKRCLDHLDSAGRLIAKIGARKIRNGMVIFTHCHSSTVDSILLEAKKTGRRFEVHNTETRPRYQGRITAKELAKAGIPVEHYVDSAARLALKKADMMLMGADAITSEAKVINKIGSELFAEAASLRDVPVYSCSDSWKFDPKTIFGYEETIEKRKPAEIWKNPPKGVRINNFAFESVDSDLITGIISEIGVYSPSLFIEEMKSKNKWIFKRLYF